ncbi:MAG TPA: S8 family serine peptidase [Xanthomonadaceae bacterium]|nr:S8 family serine peptidase [Xanthomonadaceae bacterium]
MFVRNLLAGSIALALGAGSAVTAAAEPAPPTAWVTAATADSRATLGLQDFARRSGEPVVPVLVEVEGESAFSAKSGTAMLTAQAKRDAARSHHVRLVADQDALLATLAGEGFPILPRSRIVQVAPGREHRIDYRFSYLLNGFVAFVPESRVAELRDQAGVRSVTRIAPTRLFLDNSVDYLLGSSPTIAARRTAVYGATEELGPSGSNGNGPAPTPVDGVEGQGIVVGVIDSGMDYEHPMLGGSGIGTPLPQRPPLTTTTDNQKVVYWYNLGGATTLDDHGHGTHVSSTSGGYVVDGDTPLITPTGSTPFGPPPGGVTMHGVAPQAVMMAWPVCNAAGSCAGDIELAIEDAVSPAVLTGVGDGGSIDTGVAKPVSDVINMSLGGGTDPASASARVSNSAVLAGGVVIVAAAGNDGPAEATTGAPCVGTMVICVASALDPGSTAGSDVLAEGEIVGDLCDNSNGSCVAPAPAAETGTDSEANASAPGERVGMRSFPIAGGGDLPGGSVSAHYVYVDRSQATIPPQVTGRIAVLDKGTGTFAQIVNPVALLNPAVILLISNTTSATAVAVVNDVPAFTIGTDDGAYLKSVLLSGGGAPAHGAVSDLPLRVKSSIALEAFNGALSNFSSRGPNANPNGQYRTIKPDVAGLGQNVLAATTPTGNADGGIGMANPAGYTTASGTSMASPHVAGAAALVRQRVRALGYDSIDLNDPGYRSKRFRAATIVRALLTNTATDLRTGLGGDDPDAPNPPYTVHDVGAGLVDVEAALAGHAIMTAPTVLFDTAPNEFTPPAGDLPVPVDANGNALVPLPTASFGNVPVLGSTRPVVVERAVTIEDIDGSGGGVWLLAKVDDVLSDHADVAIEFLDQTGASTITQVNVPANGAATFLVRATVSGTGTLAEGSLVSWYVHATHDNNNQRLRMPFLLRATRVALPPLGLPETPTIGNAGAPNSEGCPVDGDNAFTVDWVYDPPGGSAIDPSGYLLQRGTFEAELFADDASEVLVAGENSLWAGSAQWISNPNPDTASPSYFIADTVEQNEALTLKTGVPIPADALGASLELTTRIDTEEGFDFANIRASGGGGAFNTLGRFSGITSGTLNFDLSAFVGQDLLLQFLMTSDLLVSAPGWWVDHVRVTSNDYVVIGQVDATPTSSAQSVPAAGTWRYRVAGLYEFEGDEVIGPYTASACVCVPTSAFGTVSPDALFASGFEAGEQPIENCD